MKTACILYDGKLCNNCGECDSCDLDPNKTCDNCGKCIGEGSLDEFRSIKVISNNVEYANLDDESMDAFLDEPIELGNPEPIDIDPDLALEWEKILSDSFKKDKEMERDTDPAPALHAIRRRKERKKH